MLRQIFKILMPLFVFTSVFLAAGTVSSQEKIIRQHLPGLNQMTQQMIDFISTLTKEEQNYLKTKKVVTMRNNPNWTPIVFAKDGNQDEMRGIATDTLKERSKEIFRKSVPPSIKEPVVNYKLLGQILAVCLIIVLFFIYRKHLLNKNSTKLKTAEKQAQFEHSRMMDILEAIPYGVYIVDQHFNIEYANIVIKKEFGTIQGQKCYQYFHERTKVCPWCKNREVFAGKSVSWKWYSKRADKHFELFDFPLKNRDGSISKFEIFQDITEHKQKEELEKNYQELFNSINDLIYTQDMDGYFLSANPALQQLFGYELEEFLGHMATEFMKPKFQSGFKSQYLEVVKKQGYQEGITCYFKKNRDTIFIEYKSSLVKPEKGDPYISGIGRDVTEKILSEKKVKKLQEQVAQSQRMESIGTLAGGIAHDFNNILFPILGNVEMLLYDIPEDSPFLPMLDQIHKSTLRARDLVKQILAFSRQETSELELMEIQPIIKEALKLIRSTIPTTIEIKSDICKECGQILADPTNIHQIIMNLASNASHAMEETGGELNVKLKQVEFGEHDLFRQDIKTGKYVCLSVSDTGKGMDNDLSQKIFDPFFTTKEKGKGTGMGLSVVHGIVTGMKGNIKVYSEKGKGTEFYVYLPVAETVEKKDTVNDEISIQGGSEHILLVDDEKDIIDMEKEMLERLGYKITARTSSIEALEAFRNHPGHFDLVITDMAMPNMSGDKLSVELNKIRSDILVILCTGFSETMNEQQILSMGINGFLFKPILLKDLAHKIRELLDKK